MVLESEILRVANSIQHELAGGSLTRSIARLYSQHTKLRLGQPGLQSWTESEAAQRIGDAVRLVDVALLQRESGDENWNQGMRRAGEILEWLSHPSLNPTGLPFLFLSAAAYQIAGYPARAAGLLGQATMSEDASQILYHFLKADFPELLSSLRTYWASSALQNLPGQQRIDWASDSDSGRISEMCKGRSNNVPVILTGAV